MDAGATHIIARLAQSESDLLAAQRLRYRVFVEELGGDGPLVDHAARFERDEFDAVADHLILVDTSRSPAALEHVIGAYRLLRGDVAARLGRYYCDGEYDLTRLWSLNRPTLELGRSCIDPAHRGGPGMLLMWNALAEYVLSNEIEIMFGVASFHGIDPGRVRHALAWLHHHHLAPEALRVRSRAYQPMDLVPKAELDRRRAAAEMPALIRAYLRLGGFVGDGAFIDREFNTTDVCLLMDTQEMSARHRSFYLRKHGVQA